MLTRQWRYRSSWCDAVYFDRYIQTFRSNLPPPSGAPEDMIKIVILMSAAAKFQILYVKESFNVKKYCSLGTHFIIF
jgi:hypothetical protein